MWMASFFSLSALQNLCLGTAFRSGQGLTWASDKRHSRKATGTLSMALAVHTEIRSLPLVMLGSPRRMFSKQRVEISMFEAGACGRPQTCLHMYIYICVYYTCTKFWEKRSPHIDSIHTAPIPN